MVKIQKNFKSKLVHNNFGFFSDSVNPDPMISGFLRIRVIRKKGFGFFPDLGNPEKRVSFFFPDSGNPERILDSVSVLGNPEKPQKRTRFRFFTGFAGYPEHL